MDHFSLAAGFPPASEADWLALVAKALKNAPFDALQTELHEGLKTEPLYTHAQRRTPLSGSRGWHVIQPLTDSGEQLAGDLANGASALSINFDGEVKAQTAAKLKNRIGSDLPYLLAPRSRTADAALVISALPQGHKPGGACSAGFDPLSAYALTGERPAEAEALFADYTDAAFYMLENAPSFVPFLASGRAWDGAGCSAVQELAFTLAAGVCYWRALAEAGMPLGAGAGCIGFELTASADIFLTISKFRAMRLLWARALDAAGEKPRADLLLLARMQERILTAYDPHVNLLRGTAAAFGAAIGGATGVEVLPYDSASGEATAFSRRMARNTNLILQNESYLSAVADAAAGSAYVETLTNDLAASAWALFREVEEKGGLARAIATGFVQDELRRKAAGRAHAIAFRRDKITGVSVFPNLAENVAVSGHAHQAEGEAHHPFAGKLPELPAAGKGERFAALVAAARAGASLRELRLASRRVACPAAAPLQPSLRDAETFEALRRRADKAFEMIGSRPPIYLALLGKADDYRARLSWIQSFFAAGGIEAIIPEQGFESVEALAAAFKENPAPVACLCSSNAIYASMTGAASALKKAGAIAVYLAGPASVLKSLSSQDVIAIDRVVHDGCNALAIMEEAQSFLRVEELSRAASEEAAEGDFEVHTHVHSHDCGCC